MWVCVLTLTGDGGGKRAGISDFGREFIETVGQRCDCGVRYFDAGSVSGMVQDKFCAALADSFHFIWGRVAPEDIIPAANFDRAKLRVVEGFPVGKEFLVRVFVVPFQLGEAVGFFAGVGRLFALEFVQAQVVVMHAQFNDEGDESGVLIEPV